MPKARMLLLDGCSDLVVVETYEAVASSTGQSCHPSPFLTAL